MEKELEIKKEMKALLSSYRDGESLMSKRVDDLIVEQEKFPKKFSGSTEDYEDYILLASQCKHHAISLFRDLTALYESINTDFNYFSSQLKLYLAESFLSDHGFDKPTESLREAYVSSDETIRDFSKVKARIKANANASEKLVKAFESDETNYRRLLERQTKLTGF
jgi:hypothetical protein